jgi:argininosuccinate synthase
MQCVPQIKLNEAHMKKMTRIDQKVVLRIRRLDTSVILRWLQDTYQCEVVTFTATSAGRGARSPRRAKARSAGGEGDSSFD